MKRVIDSVEILGSEMARLLEIYSTSSWICTENLLVEKHARDIGVIIQHAVNENLKKDFDAIGKDLRIAYDNVSADLLIHESNKISAYQNR